MMNLYSKNPAFLIVCLGLASALTISATPQRLDESQELSQEEADYGRGSGLGSVPGVSELLSRNHQSDVLAKVTGGLSNLLGVQHEAPLGPQNLKGKSAALTTQDLIVGKSLTENPAPSQLAREVTKDVKKDLFSLHGIGEWAKLLFNPIELVKAIAVHFKIDTGKFVDKVGRGLLFGVEATLSPLLTCVKIVEKVFIPDACRLKFMCRMGTYLVSIRESVLKLSPHFLETSLQFKAFSDGIIGHDCESSFPACEPRLKQPYEALKVQEGISGGIGGGVSSFGNSVPYARSGPIGGLLPKLEASKLNEQTVKPIKAKSS